MTGQGTVCAILAALLLAAPAVGVEMMGVDELRPGMKGYGLSVFSGAGVERFDVEIIDVMYGTGPGSDMILCRCAGRGLEKSGIVAGMSGSPVYIDGRLIGAVAYGWNFAKEPIGGITPIHEMLRLWDMPASGAGAPGGGGRSSGPSRMKVPVAMSGYTPALADLVAPVLGEYGLIPVGSAGNADAGTAARADSLLVPGGAVGVVITDGDVKMSAIGTLTHRDGDRVLAFGHPMFQAGAAEMPMCGGVIHTVLASVAESFKLFSTTDIVGTVTQDRLPAIGGVVGPVPDMVPVTVHLRSPVVDREYRFSMMKLSPLLPAVAAIGLMNIIYSTEGVFEEMTLSSRMTVTVEDTANATARRLFGDVAPKEELFRCVLNRLTTLVENPFRPIEVTGISFDITLTPGRRKTTIVSARLDRRTARPGEPFGLSLVLRNRTGATTVRRFRATLPRTTPVGPVRLLVTSRDSLRQEEMYRAPGKAEPSDLPALFRRFGDCGGEDELVIAGFTPAPGITVGQRELVSPPPSVRAVVMDAGSATPVQATSGSPLFVDSYQFDEPISGVLELELEVRR